ncbi:hypothetical protein L1987_86395 [Smallanthus sonchifolius]|uniref:Uncharacterized protein n=1 Tax=Smallanthus sonchifolius TaxID=185202 RepID=A0ACB8XZ73_9ASTR|nr:hypothetical protein L1987_86395 [Smallanthus sonchifolius]
MRGREWQEIRYQKDKGGRKHLQSETSFFVSNLPDGCNPTVLWKALWTFGVISDAYVTKKKDVTGNFFGFVRFKVVANIKSLLEEMSSVKIFEAKVDVKVAKYGKGNKCPAQPSGINRSNHSHRVCNPKSNYPPIPPVHPGRSSYRDTVLIDPKSTMASCKSITIENNIHPYPQHCIGRSVLGVAKDIQALSETRNMLNEGGFIGAGFLYVGGLTVLLCLKEAHEAIEFVLAKERVWGNFLSSAEVWDGQVVPLEKIVIVGIPFPVRDSNVFDQVGALFGKIVSLSQFSWSNADTSSGQCSILSAIEGRIDEEIELSWNNGLYKVRVTEDSNSWAPTFTGESSSSESPSKDDDSYQDLEEGEINPLVLVVPVSGDLPDHDLSESDPVWASGKVEDHAVNNGLISDIPSSILNIEGIAAMPAGGALNNSVLSPDSNPLQAQSGVMGSDPFGFLDLIFNIGAPNKRKRNNPKRSPSIVSSRVHSPLAFPRKKVKRKSGSPSISRASDLSMNDAISPEVRQSKEASNGQGSYRVDLNRDPISVETSKEEFVESGDEDEVSGPSKNPLIDKEVHSTVEVAMCVGIDLSQHVQEVEELVLGGGDVSLL